MPTTGPTPMKLDGILDAIGGGDAAAQAVAIQKLDNAMTADPNLARRPELAGVCVRLIELAGSRHDEVRRWTAEILERHVQADPSDVAAIGTLMRPQADGETLYWACTLLGRLGGEAAGAVAMLQQCLTGSNYLPARERAAWALGRIGCGARSAMPVLDRVARQAPPRLQRLARGAMESIRSCAA